MATPANPGPAAPSAVAAQQNAQAPPSKSHLLRNTLIACAIAAALASLVSYFGQPPAAAKLASVSVTPHPAASKLGYVLSSPVARLETQDPLALRSYFTNDSDADIDVKIALSTGTACAPSLDLVQDDKHLTDNSLKVPKHDHADATAIVGAAACPAELRNSGIPLQLHYSWTESVIPATTPGQATQPKAIPVAFEAVASTSPIVFPTDAQLRWDRGLHAVQAGYNLLKDLAWPIVLAVLGFVFQRILADQADARTDQKAIEEGEATKRAEKAAQEETRRAQRLQILTHLLPEYMALVQQHYLPIARRIQTVESEWNGHHAAIAPPAAAAGTAVQQPSPPPIAVQQSAQAAVTQQAAASPVATQPAAPQTPAQPVAPENDSYARLFTAILLLRSRQLYLYEKKGGIFFRTSTGEEIFANCISEFTEKCQKLFGKDAFEAAAGSLDPEAKHPDAVRWFFEPRRPRPVDPAKRSHTEAPLPDMQAMLAAFHGWAADPGMKLDINLLRLCDKVLSFECDRIFYQTDPDQKMKPGATVNDASGWYFDAPQLAIDASMLQLPDPIRAADKDKDEDGVYSRKRTFTLLRQYLERVPEECKPKGLVIPLS